MHDIRNAGPALDSVSDQHLQESLDIPLRSESREGTEKVAGESTQSKQRRYSAAKPKSNVLDVSDN